MRRRIRRKRRIKIAVTILVVVSIGIGIGVLELTNWDAKCEKKQTISENDFCESEVESDTVEVLQETEEKKESEEVPQYKIVLKKKLIAKHAIDNPRSSFDRNINMSVAAKIINTSTNISNESEDEKSDFKKLILKKFGKKKYLLLMPEEKFSWLEIVGNPTQSKGFKKAGVIINRQPAEDWGGGVCQVSSTIYSAIYKTEIKKGKEYLYAQKHSRKSSYINPEEGDKEATVTFSGKVDFSFTNTLDYPILLKVKVKKDKVTCKVYSVKKKKVKI